MRRASWLLRLVERRQAASKRVGSVSVKYGSGEGLVRLSQSVSAAHTYTLISFCLCGVMGWIYT